MTGIVMTEDVKSAIKSLNEIRQNVISMKNWVSEDNKRDYGSEILTKIALLESDLNSICRNLKQLKERL